MEVRITQSNTLERLYTENYRRIYLFVFSLCKNEETAKDITQDAFIKAMLSLPEDAVNPLAWLYKVANNLVMDEFRRGKFVAQLPEGEENEISTQTDTTAEQYIQQEQYRRLYKALDMLEQTDKKLIMLFYFSGLSQRDIAAVTSLSFANVRVRMNRARNKLKTILTEDEIL